MIEDKLLRKILLFVISTAFLGLAVGHLVIKPSFTKLLLTHTENNAAEFTQHIKEMLFAGHPPGKRIKLEDERQHLDELLDMSKKFNISRLRLFDSTGNIILSTEPGEIGEINTNAYFRDIVARGKIYTKLNLENSRSAEGQIVSTDLVEIYVPIMHNESFDGAMEVYYDISSEMQSLQGTLVRANVLTIGLVVIYLVIIIALLLRLDRILIDRKNSIRELRQSNNFLALANAEIEDNRNQLDDTLDHLTSLIQEVLTNRKIGIHDANPSLVKCYKELNCTKTECACHGIEATRCWQVVGTYCGGEPQGGHANKYGDCIRCEVFLKATSSPRTKIGELFNNMLHIIEVKQSELERINENLQKAISEIKTLRGIVPICCHCKKIRDDNGFWNKVETYVEKHTDALFSHGICNECQKRYYPEIDLDEDVKE